MIVSCNSMWITLAPHDTLIKNMALVFVLIGVLLGIFAKGVVLHKKKLLLSLIFTAVFGVYLAIYLFATWYKPMSFLKVALVFFALLFYYFFVEKTNETPQILIRYEYIVTGIAVASLICWLVFSVFELIPPSAPEMTWWNGTDHYTEVTSFYGIYFEPQEKKIFGEWIGRNCNIFTEAPMASLHFSIALLINLFARKKMSKVRAVILLIAIATTFSATGYVIAALAVAFKIILSVFRSAKYADFSKGGKTIVKILVLIVILLAIAACIYVVSGRVGGESWTIRNEDLKGAFQAWFDKPIFGNGFANFDAVKAHYHAERAAAAGFSSTTGLGTIFADGGAFFGLLYVGAVVCAIIKAIKNKEYEMIVFALLVLAIFLVTIVAYDYIILYLFIFMGAYKSKVKQYFEKRYLNGEQ